MASKRQTYPFITATAWWALRRKFNQSIPNQVTPRYLVSVFGGSEATLRRNVLQGLKIVGLVDEDGVTTEKAQRWRDDTTYPEVCSRIVNDIYPEELQSAAPGPTVDRAAAKRWFMVSTRCGEPAGRRMAAMYALLVEANPVAGDEAKVNKLKKVMGPKSKRPATPSDGPQQPQPASNRHDPPRARVDNLNMPEMRLSLEIRIDASVTPEQIDQIFASMAKHLYRRDNERQ